MTERQRQERFLDRLQAAGIVLSWIGAVVLCVLASSAVPVVAWALGVLGGMWFGVVQGRTEELWREWDEPAPEATR